MKSVFGGAIADGLVFPYPEPNRADADAVHSMLDAIRRLKSLDAAEIDREERIGRETLDALRDANVFGLLVPKELGGTGLGVTGSARVVQGLAALDASVALSVTAHAALGVSAILLFGGEELKSRVVPRLAKGTALAAFCLAETGAGSDAASIQTRADLEGDTYVLSGEKTWVTNGSLADVFVVFARTSPAEDGAKPRITAFVVERGPGVVVGPDEPKLGVRGVPTNRLTLEHVRIPRSNVLGEVGRGFKVAMEVLTQARPVLSASCVGAAKKLLRLSVERSTSRKTFGRAIAEFPLVKDKIALMSAEIFALESATYLTTGLVDAGRTDFSIESAICKVLGSETLWRVANESLQIAGALGYTRTQPWERMLRDARAPMVFAGTNEILRAFIALSGMQGPSRELEDVSKSMREPIKGFGPLRDFAIRKAMSVLARERVTRASPVLSREAVLFEEYVGHLAKNVDKVLRRHGKNISEMQFSQKRAADVAIDLYALAACLSRTSRAIDRRGEEGARREIDLTSVFATAAERRLKENIAAFDDNDDELRKAVADKTVADGGYPLDVI